MRLFTLLSVVLLASCMSNSQYDLDMSMSELSDAIANESGPVVDLSSKARPTRSSAAAVGVFIDAQSHYHDPYSDDLFANNRFLISRRSALNIGLSSYRLNSGYGLSYTGGDDVYQMRLGLFYHDADFNDPDVSEFNSPIMLGFDVDGHVLFPVNQLEFFVGLRATSSLLHYQFDKPIEYGNQLFQSDELSVFGLGVPFGMQLNSGYLSLETLIAPTLFFHGFETNLGVDNSLGFLNGAVPMSVGVGVNF
jgi:hypothetical protein